MGVAVLIPVLIRTPNPPGISLNETCLKTLSSPTTWSGVTGNKKQASFAQTHALRAGRIEINVTPVLSDA